VATLYTLNQKNHENPDKNAVSNKKFVFLSVKNLFLWPTSALSYF